MTGWEYTHCRHCGARVQLVNFAMGEQWMHLPTPWGNWRTRELYLECRNSTVAAPELDSAGRIYDRADR